MAANRRQVFIVDDDEDDRNFLREAFLENGYPDHFVLFETGVKMMEFLLESAFPPALIIIDLHMPGRGGGEIVNEIKSNPKFKSIPVVLLTTGLIKEIKIQMLRLGTNCVVAKPNSYDETLDVTKCIGLLWNLSLTKQS
ncbi:MAG: response regulator [Flavisolibacter sp.]